jgi:hypothetical protein
MAAAGGVPGSCAGATLIPKLKASAAAQADRKHAVTRMTTFSSEDALLK